MPLRVENLLALLYQSEINQTEEDLVFEELRQVARSSGVTQIRAKQLFNELKHLISSAARKKINVADLFSSCDFIVDATEQQSVQQWFEQHRDALFAIYESKSNEMPGFLATNRAGTLQSVPLEKVVDVDWRLVVSVASSESDRLAATHVQVRLGVAGAKGGAAVRHIPLEMTVAQFYGFLHELRKMKAALDAVTV